MNDSGLLFQFPSEDNARLAADTLRELGYEPHLYEGARARIQVRDEDLTSALEIAQIYGGELSDRAPADVQLLSAEAYGLGGIPIPAHTVNEDWEESYRSADVEPERVPEEDGLRTDDGSYDFFDAR